MKRPFLLSINYCLLRRFLLALQNDDVKLYDNQSDFWKTFGISNSIAVNHGWRNSKVLEASSPGLGKLTASLSYPSGHVDRKEVMIPSNYFIFFFNFFLLNDFVLQPLFLDWPYLILSVTIL